MGATSTNHNQMMTAYRLLIFSIEINSLNQFHLIKDLHMYPFMSLVSHKKSQNM